MLIKSIVDPITIGPISRLNKLALNYLRFIRSDSKSVYHASSHLNTYTYRPFCLPVRLPSFVTLLNSPSRMAIPIVLSLDYYA